MNGIQRSFYENKHVLVKKEMQMSNNILETKCLWIELVGPRSLIVILIQTIEMRVLVRVFVCAKFESNNIGMSLFAESDHILVSILWYRLAGVMVCWK